VADGWIALPLIPAPASARAVSSSAFAEPPPPPGFAEAPAWRALSGAGVHAVIELPPGEPIVDFPAMYRSMFHHLPVVNGFSGFVPPHYLPLTYAIVHGQFAALEELAAGGPIGVIVDRSVPWHENMETFMSRLGTAMPLAADDQWTSFVVTTPPRAAHAAGRRLEPAAIQVNRQPQDVVRLADGRIETAWGPGTPQNGDEEVRIDLGSVQPVGAIVLCMGSYSFGFPRELAVDLSSDGEQWQTVWRGETAVSTVRAAIADPSSVPVTFDLGSAQGRFIRLRQLGRDAQVPWWIAELRVEGR
jgi:hypothetical protein